MIVATLAVVALVWVSPPEAAIPAEQRGASVILLDDAAPYFFPWSCEGAPKLKRIQIEHDSAGRVTVTIEHGGLPERADLRRCIIGSMDWVKE